MKTRILSINGKVIVESDTLTLLQLVEQNKHKLFYANLSDVCLIGADLSKAGLRGADLRNANLNEVHLHGAILAGANLVRTNLCKSDLHRADLYGTDLTRANLTRADLCGADLRKADLRRADLTGANLIDTCLDHANLANTIGLTKPMGVKPGDIYWKRFGDDLINEGYQFKVGLNELRPYEVFASDERVMCSFPGFHFASREWCTKNYSWRPYEAKIRIPLDAKINEPWSTDGKASSDKIEILQVFETKTGKDVTKKFKKN
jgi:hypothetical protein